ncbi:MAG: class A beta-lactamase-related serine hydrolase [Oscillospiraceae bacterium]|nr:class A beta-lactamase-related serine hydrolase [Oscillospiraceae bacterium]
MKKIIAFVMVISLTITWIQLCYMPQFKEKIEPVISNEDLFESKHEFHDQIGVNITIVPESSVDRVMYEKSHEEKLEDLKNNIINFVGNDINSFSLIYYEIVSKNAIEINPYNSFKPASTYKVPLNMLLYDKVFTNEININDTMNYYSGDYEDGAGELQGSDILYHPISLTTLSEYSIIYSDNIAANMLTRLLGYDDVISYIERVSGIQMPNTDYITAQAMLSLLLKLYTNLDNNPFYDTLIGYMKNTIYHDRIDALIPQSIVAHKIGDYEDYVNDIGIVYTNKPYIIIFYTEGFEYETIAEISKMIYDFNIQD